MMIKIIYIFFLIIFSNLKSFKIPKISIIIPSYNIPNYYYLKKSINSVLNQTLKNIELIIVDDNAYDQTPIILDNYAMIDSRVTIIHKIKNEMTGYARNTGLDFIMGEYLGFLDYDDLFHQDALKLSFNEAKKKNYTIVNFEYKKFKNENSILKYLNNKNNIYHIDLLNKYYNFPFKFVNTWADEDVLFCITIFSFEIEILLIKKPLVFHRLLKSSIGHNLKIIEKRQNLILYHLKNIFKIYKKYGIINNRIVQNIFVLFLKNHFKNKNIEKLLRLINGYKTLFPIELIRKYYINIYNMKKLEKLYIFKENTINQYEIIINKKLNCFI